MRAAVRPAPVLERFASLPQVVTLVERGERHAVGLTVEGLPVELRVPPPERFGTELVRATGADDFVEALEPLPDAADEAALFAALRLPFVAPELREATLGAAVPELVEPDAIRGDLHVHTTWSDGKASVLEMAEAAQGLGYEYLAICDHTPPCASCPGSTPTTCAGRARRSRAPTRSSPRSACCEASSATSSRTARSTCPTTCWRSSSGFRRASTPASGRRERAHARVEEALRHPAVRCLSHPKGRASEPPARERARPRAVVEVALETGVALEVNGLPDRLDLRDEHVRLAVEAGVRVVCSTDAHSVRGLGNMRLSVATARRGHAGAADVLNTLPLARFPARRA